MAKYILHEADSRGDANHGWLHSKHTFSFANYYDSERIHFGALRVLNDDKVAEGMGFGAHPHQNMEIVSIPLKGALAHKDSMGNEAAIKFGEIQVMSAGTGVTHSEYNYSKEEAVEFLQIWIIPNKNNVTPRHEQKSISFEDVSNQFVEILSPASDQNDTVWIHQDAWFHLGNFDADVTEAYQIKKQGNGVYVFVLEGEVEVDGNKLNTRDGLGIWETETIQFKTTKKSKILLIEVPMYNI